MKLLVDARLLLTLILVFCVPVVHNYLPTYAGDATGGAQTYCCNSTGTVGQTCGQIKDKPKCSSEKTVCKGQAQSGNTIYCHDGTGGVDPGCRNNQNCTSDSDAETHDCGKDC